MTLSYLSGDMEVDIDLDNLEEAYEDEGDEMDFDDEGDSVGSKRSRRKRRAARKAKRLKRRTARQLRRIEHRRKAKKKMRFAKIALAPARGAYLLILRLNAGKSATKMARIYKKKGGIKELKDFWTGLGGRKSKQFARLKKAIQKGSKESLGWDEMDVRAQEIGALSLAVAMATATPILIAAAKIIKKFKAQGDAEEQKEYEDIIKEGKAELIANPDFEKGTGEFSRDDSVGVVSRPGYKQFSEEDEDQDEDDDAMSFFSPLGVFFKTPLMLGFIETTNPVLLFFILLITTYCLIGFVIFGLVQFAGLNQLAVYWTAPWDWVQSLVKKKQNEKKI